MASRVKRKNRSIPLSDKRPGRRSCSKSFPEIHPQIVYLRHFSLSHSMGTQEVCVLSNTKISDMCSRYNSWTKLLVSATKKIQQLQVQWWQSGVSVNALCTCFKHSQHPKRTNFVLIYQSGQSHLACEVFCQTPDVLEISTPLEVLHQIELTMSGLTCHSPQDDLQLQAMAFSVQMSRRTVLYGRDSSCIRYQQTRSCGDRCICSQQV